LYYKSTEDTAQEPIRKMTTSGDGGVLSEWKVETEAERSGKDALAVKIEKKEVERSGKDALAKKLDKLEAMAERNSEKWQECKESIKVWQDKLMAIPPFPGEGEQNTLENWIEYRIRLAGEFSSVPHTKGCLG